MKALRPCGTNAAYVRHRNAGEEACRDCKNAHADYMSNYRPKAGRGDEDRAASRSRARQRAFRALAELHPAVFDALFATELTVEGLAVAPGGGS